MDTAVYVTMLILNFVAIGMIYALLVKWKKEDIKLKQHLLPTIIFAVADIAGIAAGVYYVPIFLPSLAVVLLGINLRKEQWPDTPKFAEYYKIYVFVLAFCLMSGLGLLDVTYAVYLRGLGFGFVDITDYIFIILFALIPLLVFVSADPLDRKDRRNTEHLVGAGLGLGGAILGIVLMFLLKELPICEVLAIILSIVSLAAALLLFLPFFPRKKYKD